MLIWPDPGKNWRTNRGQVEPSVQRVRRSDHGRLPCSVRNVSGVLKHRIPGPLLGIPPNSPNKQQIDTGEDDLYCNDHSKHIDGIIRCLAIRWNCDIHGKDACIADHSRQYKRFGFGLFSPSGVNSRTTPALTTVKMMAALPRPLLVFTAWICN